MRQQKKIIADSRGQKGLTIQLEDKVLEFRNVFVYQYDRDGETVTETNFENLPPATLVNILEIANYFCELIVEYEFTNTVSGVADSKEKKIAQIWKTEYSLSEKTATDIPVGYFQAGEWKNVSIITND